MTFAQPWWLLVGALAAGLVVALHARRRRRAVVPSLQLWRMLAGAEARSTAWTAPRVSWPLVLQVLSVLLIAVALADPRPTDSAPRHTVLLLDVSASMAAARDDGRTPF